VAINTPPPRFEVGLSFRYILKTDPRTSEFRTEGLSQVSVRQIIS